MTATAPPSPDTATAQVAASALNLSKVYGSDRTAVRALDEVSLNLHHGTFTAIMGASGSGKSTLMHCLAGLDHITSGRVFLGGVELSTLNDRELTKVRRDRIGFVFQSFNLLPTLTAKDNILLPLDLAGRKPEKAHFTALVNSLGIGDRLDHRPAELSGGQQQRVAIARALVGKPDILFADEPTGALDSRTGQALLDYLRMSCHEGGQTIVMVTHDPIAAAYADRVVILSDGRITHDLDDPDADSVLGIIRGQAA